ncbi:hypothetical protein D3C87_2036940 [compost metagenome]
MYIDERSTLVGLFFIVSVMSLKVADQYFSVLFVLDNDDLIGYDRIKIFGMDI